MKVLISFETVPEGIERAIIDMTIEEYAYFSKAHNYYINGAEYSASKDEATNVILKALSKSIYLPEDCENEAEMKYLEKWLVNNSNTDLSDVEAMIFCGFYL